MHFGLYKKNSAPCWLNTNNLDLTVYISQKFQITVTDMAQRAHQEWSFSVTTRVKVRMFCVPSNYSVKREVGEKYSAAYVSNSNSSIDLLKMKPTCAEKP